MAMHDPGVSGAPATIAVDGAAAEGEQTLSATVAGRHTVTLTRGA
jgi:hypothetical protein